MRKQVTAYTILGSFLTLTTAGGAATGVYAYQTIKDKEQTISDLKETVDEKNNLISETKEDLKDAKQQTEKCTEQAKHYWTSAVRMGDALMEYIDWFPYRELNMDKAIEERDAGDAITGCYVRTGDE